jgi:hypothetical protein
MHINQFHSLPIDNQYKNDILTEMAKTAAVPVVLQRSKNEFKTLGRGIGEMSARNIMQALAMWMVEKNIEL